MKVVDLPRRCAIVFALHLLMVEAPLYSQCSGPTTLHLGVADLTRQSSNSVKALAGTQTIGDYWWTWDAYVASTEKVDAAVIHTGSDLVGTGEIASLQWIDAPSVEGVGTWRIDNFHDAASTCGDYTDYTTFRTLEVLRPERPDYSSSGGPITYLGPGNSADGPYKASSGLVPGATNGATGTPVWIYLESGTTSGYAHLSCTSCSATTITADNASDNCLVYNVQVKTSYGGLESDPMYIFIERPDQTTFEMRSDNPYFGGYLSQLVYKTYVMCGQQMNDYHINETFGSTSDVISNNWPGFTDFPADHITSGAWLDAISAVDSDPGCGGTCTPSPISPLSPLGSTKVERALQTWRVGSTTNGSGIAVQVNYAERFLDHGDHQ